MDRWTDVQTDGQTAGRTDEQKDKQTKHMLDNHFHKAVP